jgi:hypothetical protein
VKQAQLFIHRSVSSRREAFSQVLIPTIDDRTASDQPFCRLPLAPFAAAQLISTKLTTTVESPPEEAGS